MNSSILMCFVLVCLSYALGNEEQCPEKCVCKTNTQKDGGNYLKLKCGDVEKIHNLDELELLNVASEIVQLNLSDNHLKSFDIKFEMVSLQKLDLSGNQLSELQGNQFRLVSNLRRLDLSRNRIKSIDLHAFDGLRHLERLKLMQNDISTVSQGTFDGLHNLKQLDISLNPLQCDCGLLWLLDWSQNTNIKLVSNPKCTSPPTFKGISLRKLKIGVDIHCKSSDDLPIIELKPHTNQIVFEGDPLTLQCKAASISDAYDSSKLEWRTNLSDVHVEDSFVPSSGMIVSSVRIERLHRHHAGVWTCFYVSTRGNHSKSIDLTVISDATRYCPLRITSDNKGVYNWPKTIVNNTVSLACVSINMNYDVERQMASFRCDSHGNWSDLDTSQCSYVSDTTKILEQFSMVNASVLESARHFRNYTWNLGMFRDVVDVVFAVRTIENYLSYAESDVLLGVLLEVVGRLMELPRWYLRQAERGFACCRRLVNVTERLGIVGASTLLQKENIVVEVFPAKRDGFTGIKCTWYVNPTNRLDALFSCSTNNQQEPATLQGKTIEASVTVPDDLFDRLQDEHALDLPHRVYNIVVAMHADSRLFPIDEKRVGREDVTSAVVGVKIVDVPVMKNLSRPVFVMLRTPPATVYEVTPFVPVRWDGTANDGNGTWTADGCSFSHQLPDHVVFSCTSLGYYGLLQDASHLVDIDDVKFKPSHPAIYFGSTVIFVSFLVVILTYLFGYESIQMGKKTKHSLVNTWTSIWMLCFMYSFGIYQTEDVKLCQIVGMLLHYLTLCSLLWMCVTLNCMYKKLCKNDSLVLEDDELRSERPLPKPILGIYLVGWGVALIICGLSAAINMKEYASRTHCFLRTGPALSALYIPFFVLTLFLVVVCLLVRCAIYNNDVNGHLSEGTQATEHVDLDLLETNGFANGDVTSMTSTCKTSEIEDTEHSVSAQLKAHVIFLVLYVATWLSCAFSTIPPFKIVSYEEDLFSVAYAILCTTLSAFTLFFYGVARSDVRAQWAWLLCGCARTKTLFKRRRHVSDTFPSVVQRRRDNATTSRSSSRSSKTNSQNVLRGGAVDLNGSFGEQHVAKINNVNLVVLHRAQYVIPNIIENPTSAAEVFYNPHQSTVARKFFKRQKRNLMKRNNLGKRTTTTTTFDTDTASVFSEPKVQNNAERNNMFGTNSKVNNTNIHVEQTMRKQVKRKNVNIFSDSGEDFDDVVPMEKIVLDADRLRRKCKTKKSTEVNDVRSVSQQCTLEYSSENVSDSILDKNSPVKIDEGLLEVETKDGRGRVYVNPLRDGSVSAASDLDELYQQIRRGPRPERVYGKAAVECPCFSDSEVNSWVGEAETCARRATHSLSDETTV